jgi:hypothetical protein
MSQSHGIFFSVISAVPRVYRREPDLSKKDNIAQKSPEKSGLPLGRPVPAQL